MPNLTLGPGKDLSDPASETAAKSPSILSGGGAMTTL